MTTVSATALHRDEAAKLQRFFQRVLGNRADAADATQETYLRLLTALSRTTVEHRQAFLFQIARNLAASIGQRRRREASLFLPATEAQLAHIVDGQARPEQQVAARQSLRRLAAAIDELPPRCREAFLLSRLDGLPNGDVALRLGVSRNMVEKHLIRAMLHCRRRCHEFF